MKQTGKPLLIINSSQLITVAGFSDSPAVRESMSQLSIIYEGAIFLENGIISELGTTNELLQILNDRLDEIEVIDATGKIVLPGLVDPHTHLVFSGTREAEFTMRLKGATYMEIMNNGGGIHATTSKTREASEEMLFEESKKRLERFLEHGVTTIEAKSGYGLDWETEYKQLRVAQLLNEQHPVDVVSTFMGAHAVPKEYKENPDAYVKLVCEEMIPKVAEEKLADFNDVFCERGVFTPEQSRIILEAGKKYGLKPKLHADEIEPYEGAELAAELKAVSADHLLRASDSGIAAMAEAGVIGVLLPGTAFFLMTEAAKGRKMIDAGVAVAISTDCNPGSSPTVSTPFIMNLACMNMGLTPEEAITAVTINAAHAIAKNESIGSLEKGKKADVVILNVPNYMLLQYHYGMNHTDMVIKNGEIVVREGKRC
ncbi:MULTISPECIES: imidazolonepropionase [unclassified Bacillus (in: firmicutes)]|uniref:imidazolonepropionase n=1 Tax=unclassified Bacillus (in: firmicutes) TaxID=185979 RepID=UPI0008F337CB|nr:MULTISPECIES: imidazolonepropionase [unclassified Bacillus (in: firmicutes)]SFA91386.1 imidazolonepropionase [Bacillus sp. UNCCL13]SFQ85566.1 imidazolonepropionase [Bacillus sp. cl95]